MTVKSEWLCFPLHLLWFYYCLQIRLSRLWDVKIGESRMAPWTEFSVDLALMLKLLVFLNNSIHGSLNCWDMLCVSQILLISDTGFHWEGLNFWDSFTSILRCVYFRKFLKAESVEFSIWFTTLTSKASDHILFSNSEVGLIIRVTKKSYILRLSVWAKGAFNEN